MAINNSLIIDERHVLYLSKEQQSIQMMSEIVSKYEVEHHPLYSFTFEALKVDNAVSLYKTIAKTQKEHFRNLFVIIDYIFFWTDAKSSSFSSAISSAILSFPDVNFFFDKTGFKTDKNSFKSFMDVYDFDAEFHGFDINDLFDNSTKEYSFKEVFMRDNLFDASGLRQELRKQKFDILRVQDNFGKLHNSRKEHFCICVEEERSQSLFNCYCMYAHGYRALPVSSSSMLKKINTSFNDNKGINLIIRDYDLQFADEKEDNTHQEYNEIDLIRGWKKSNGKWEDFRSKVREEKDSNPYWAKLYKIPTLYITKGDEGMELKPRKTKEEIIDKDKKILSLVGLSKPISGVYEPFRQVFISDDKKNPKDVYDNSRETSDIKVSRDGGNHSAPLDIYSIVRSIVNRASEYYEKKRYVHSAIIAEEAIELMNGFHPSLMLGAYKIKALAENAIAANIIGGDENMLRSDTEFRLEAIKKEVRRISAIGNTDTEKSRNILNQIYNDMRVFCREKEHFLAEDAIISAIAHESESFKGFRRLIDILNNKTNGKESCSNNNTDQTSHQ